MWVRFLPGSSLLSGRRHPLFAPLSQLPIEFASQQPGCEGCLRVLPLPLARLHYGLWYHPAGTRLTKSWLLRTSCRFPWDPFLCAVLRCWPFQPLFLVGTLGAAPSRVLFFFQEVVIVCRFAAGSECTYARALRRPKAYRI